MQHNRFIIPSAILGLSLLISILVFSLNWKSIKKENQTITVTGSAKKEINADLGILRGNLSAYANSQKAAYEKLESQKPILLNFFQSKGFNNDKVNFETFTVYPQYQYINGAQGAIIGYNASQTFKIESKDVNLIRSISLDISSLYSQGLEFQVFNPEYYYTKLAEMKIDIQAEAAKDAKNRAQKIAEATNSKIGTMRNARMGVLQITPINSNMVSDYGMNDVSSIEKEITAVVNASFEIE
jgi:uncharacterized protein